MNALPISKIRFLKNERNEAARQSPWATCVENELKREKEKRGRSDVSVRMPARNRDKPQKIKRAELVQVLFTVR